MKVFRVLILMVLIICPLWTNPIVDKVFEELNPSLGQVFTGEVQRGFNSLNLLSSNISSLNDWESLYSKTTFELWKGRALLALNDKKSAEDVLDEVIDMARDLQKLSQDELSLKAESYRLEADARAELMLFKGVPTIIRNGGKVLSLAEKTLSLDPDNIDAAIIYAQGRINAPAIFGGDREEGMTILLNLWNRRNNEKMKKAQFYRLVQALGDSLIEEDPSRAEYYYRQGREIIW